MKICCISDIHSQYKNLILPKADMLIISGDIDIYYSFKELSKFNKWIGEQEFKYKVVIAGNHDKLLSENTPKLTRQLLSNAIYLENDGREIEGLKIWGSPITPRFQNWFFMEDRDKIHRYWDMIPKCDILVTHGPSFGILDSVGEGHKLYTSVGCLSLLEKVKEIKPKYHIFGHIHYSYGIHKNEYTTFVNCSVCNEEYELTNPPIEIEI